MAMKEDSENLIKFPLEILRWCGQNPEQNKIKYGLVSLIYLLCSATALITILPQFLYINGNITAIAENCEASATYTQVIGKTLVGFVKIESFREMIGDTKTFWNFRNMQTSRQMNLKATLVRTLRLEKIYIRLIILTILSMVSVSVLKKKLPTGVWILPDYDQLYSYVLIFHEFCLPLFAVFISGLDCLFLSLCVSLKTQFKMLRLLLNDLKISTVFSNTDERAYLNTLKSYIQYHDFLLRFSRNMQDAYSLVMLIQYSTNLLSLLGEMYVLFESTNIVDFPRYTVAMASILMQLSFYCIPLNYVTDEAIRVSQGIYESEWCSKHVSVLRTTIPLLIQRSQREIVFKAGGMFEVNCRTVPFVIRTAYSVCTVLRALKKV